MTGNLFIQFPVEAEFKGRELEYIVCRFEGMLVVFSVKAPAAQTLAEQGVKF